ncbi:MAG: T9SS type A sorting domain-containing protein [Bacteroidales bacterium]|nr:T9SS type A sorting domain-containing protein [Bacteroidales bacterium]
MKTNLTTFLLIFGVCMTFGQQIKKLTPNKGERNQLLTVSVSGNNTHFYQASTTLVLYKNFRIITGESVVALNDNVLSAQFDIPQNAALGSYSLLLYNSQDGVLGKKDAFTVTENIEPKLVKVNPKKVPQNENLTVSVTGQNVNFKQGTSTVMFSQGTNTVYGNVVKTRKKTLDVEINTTTPTGIYDAHVFYYDYTRSYALMLPEALKIVEDKKPAIRNISPKTGFQDELLTVKISGKNTNFTQSTSTVYLTNNYYYIFADYSYAYDDKTLVTQFHIPSHAQPGMYTMNVYNDKDGFLTKENGFEIIGNTNIPAITHVTPNEVKQNEHLQVTVSGQNVNFYQGTSTVRFRQGSNTIYGNVVGTYNTFLDVEINTSAPLGYYDAEVEFYDYFNGYYTIKKSDALKITPQSGQPMITNVEPNKFPEFAPLEFTISGVNTHFQQATNTVRIENEHQSFECHVMEIFGDTLITARYGYGIDSAGYYDVVVENAIDGKLAYYSAIQIGKAPKGVSAEKELTSNNDYHLYPNPATNFVNIKSNWEGLTKYTIMNIDGKAVQMGTFTKGKEDHPLKLDNLQMGIYYLELQNNNNVSTKKIMIK